MYLLKYTLKPLDCGPLRPSQDESLDRVLRQLVKDPFARKVGIAQAHITPLTCNDLALVDTETSIVSLSTRVSYVECKSPAARSMVVRKNAMRCMEYRNSMASYVGRIRSVFRGQDISILSMTEFHDRFVIFSKAALQKSFNANFDQPTHVASVMHYSGTVCPNRCPLPQKYRALFVGYDNWGDLVFTRSPKELVRYSVADPATDLEEFAFYLLCRKVAFFNEEDLLHDGSYVLAAVHKFKLLDTTDKIRDSLSTYHRNRYSSALFTDAYVDSVSALLNSYVPEAPRDCDITSVDMSRATALSEDIASTLPPHDLDSQQQRVLHTLSNATGLYILTGGPGTGKSFLTKHVIMSLCSKGVMVSASTANAAQLLSKQFGRTVHLNYAFTGRQPKDPRRSNPTSKKLTALAKCRVHVVDEFTMLSKTAFNLFLYRIQQTQNLNSFTEVLQQNLVLLVGDHCQLPPVCSCKIARHQGICAQHSVVAHPAFRSSHDNGRIFHLQVCHRNSAWASVLNHIRTAETITDAWVDENINKRLQTVADLPSDLSGFRAICSHRTSVTEWNTKLLKSQFSSSQIFPVFPHVERVQVDAAGDLIPDLTTSLRKGDLTEDEKLYILTHSRKYQLSHCAIGAPVRITENIDPDNACVNSVRGTVVGMNIAQETLRSVEIDIDGTTRHVGRLVPETKCVNKRYLRWFSLPLTLDYAGTVHSYQGSTISEPLIIDLKDVFEVGMGYVAISRSTDTANMYLAKPLTAFDLRVPNLASFYAWLDDHIVEEDDV